ncbi:MAG: MBL fold metallo-hydrolase [Gemmatimonadaceae bacterium]
MKITLVSHASLLIETNGMRLLTDPWYSGRIYHNAWELCPPPPALPDFRSLDAIFVSHAHPDHYHRPTLEQIREERGGDIPVFVAEFFHDTIARDLRELGFRAVIEMTPGVEFRAFPRVSFFSQQFRMDDSLLVVVGHGDETLVNINDAPLRGSTLIDLAKRFPRVDYCAAQFAIAQGYPYCYDNVQPDFTREDLVRRFDSFAQTLKPRHMIPFASFVRFCNGDNTHMNQHKMGLDELVKVSTAKLTVLYPGDSIERGEVSSDEAHRARFEAAQRDESYVTALDGVPLDDLDHKMRSFTRKLVERVPTLFRRKLPRFAFILSDYPWGYLVANDQVQRRPAAELENESIQYRLASEVLAEAVDHDWGWADLSIGARFRARVLPGYENREIWFWVIPMLGGEGYLTLRTLWFIRPRALRIWWGRRLEVFDYLRNLLTGRFMTAVVRKKTSAIRPGRS